MKKFLALIITAALLIGFSLSAQAAAKEYKIPNVKAYILTEANTNEVLLAHNENEKLPILSLAKIMTLLIIAEEIEAGNIAPEDKVPASLEAHRAKAPVIWLDPGEVMTLRDLMKSVVMASANDATIALAEYISGNGEEFTKRMNARAQDLGMNDTFFADCGGFTPETLSTARDVAIMTAELFKHDVFGKYFKTRLDAVREGTEREAQLVNTNKMAHWYEGIIGGKAGHGKDAGLCITNCAERGNMRLVSVVLGAGDEDDRVNLCEYLLDAGFKDFEFFVPDLDEAQFTPVKVLRGVSKVVEAVPHTAVKFTAPRGEGSNARFEYVLPESITAPVEKGQVIGTLKVHLNGKVVAESEIVTLRAIDELTFEKSFEILLERFFNSS